MKGINLFCLIVVIFIYAVLTHGYVVEKYWEWFISPTFQIKELSYSQSIGIAFFISLFKSSGLSDKEYGEDDLLAALVKVAVWPWLNLLLGYIALTLFQY